MNNTMINAIGFPEKEYDDEVTGKGVIQAHARLAHLRQPGNERTN
nr:MAG TPA: hypothetical protein [Caudoviricetes sp.]